MHRAYSWYTPAINDLAFYGFEPQTPPYQDTSTIVLGSNGPATGFRGCVDELAAYPRVLSAAEVSALFRCKSLPCPPSSPPPPTAPPSPPQPPPLPPTIRRPYGASYFFCLAPSSFPAGTGPLLARTGFAPGPVYNTSVGVPTLAGNTVWDNQALFEDPTALAADGSLSINAVAGFTGVSVSWATSVQRTMPQLSVCTWLLVRCSIGCPPDTRSLASLLRHGSPTRDPAATLELTDD